jgi:hypothetical protein
MLKSKEGGKKNSAVRMQKLLTVENEWNESVHVNNRDSVKWVPTVKQDCPQAGDVASCRAFA